MAEDLGKEAIIESAKAVAVEAYKDTLQPALKTAGSIVALPIQAVDAALSRPKLWVAEKQFNYKRTLELLAEKLSNTPVEQIEPPEPHIAVPALQYISYCMDNDELRDMYANLLASSMNSVVKNGVHPGFVEIIKQLCPDEAKILRYLSVEKVVPAITLRSENEKGEGKYIIQNFSNIGELVGCDLPYEINKYFNNLTRLGLLEKSPIFTSLTNKGLYEGLKNHPHIVAYVRAINEQNHIYYKPSFQESFFTLTDYGESFCEICVSTDGFVVYVQSPNE